MTFIVISTKQNQYGNKVEQISIREATNAWELSETLRIEDWSKNRIKQVKYDRV
jgi:hypothetical protein